MSWQPEVDEIQERLERASALGGEERIARQHNAGRLTIRERIDALTDAGSFFEIGALAGSVSSDSSAFVPDGYVGGLARIDGREVVVGGEDFTIRGGSEGSTKPYLLERMSCDYRIPMVLLNDGAGFNIGTLLDNNAVVLPGTTNWRPMVEMMATVPVVAAILGSVAGYSAGRAMMTHWTVMTKGTSEIFTAGPPVVKRSIGQDLTKQQLGGSHIHTRISGAVDNEAQDEPHCFQLIRQYLSYMPSNVWQEPPYHPPADRPDRREEALLTIVPRNRRRAYDMRRLVRMVLDDRELFEIQPFWGAALITGLARLNGHVVGVLASNPQVRAGALHAQEAEKQVHFMELCDQFGIPLIYFVDVPGLMVGLEAESAAVIRKGMRAVWMTAQLRVPLIDVVVGRCYGFGGAAARNASRTTPAFAWPSAEFGGIPIEGGVDAAFRRVIEAAPDPDAKRLEIQDRLRRLVSPFPPAEHALIEAVIDPRDTRPTLIRALEAALPSVDRSHGPRSRAGVRP